MTSLRLCPIGLTLAVVACSKGEVPTKHDSTSANEASARAVAFAAQPAPNVSSVVPTTPVASSQPTNLEPQWEQIVGTPGVSEKWGSGWLDLASPRDFRKGTELRLQVGGPAKTVAVRLLKVGASPDDKSGVVGQYNVPPDGWVNVRIAADYERIKQVSVHGKFAWRIWGSPTNGSATLLKVEMAGSLADGK